MKSDYQERRQNRIDRYKELAAKNEHLSDQLYNTAHKMADAIPFGQPILVGHHSEKRDRNYRDKIHNKFGKAFEASDKAKHYADRAETAENSDAISSDNPDALDLLKEKLDGLIKGQETMKACNKIIKSKKLSDVEKISRLVDLGLKEETANKLLIPVYGRIGVPRYKLTNNNANIKRIKDRIAYLEKMEATPYSEEIINGVKLVVNPDDNRVQIFFDSIPSEEVRANLKTRGFRWAPTVGAWMRQLSNGSIYWAKEILKNLKP